MSSCLMSRGQVLLDEVLTLHRCLHGHLRDVTSAGMLREQTLAGQKSPFLLQSCGHTLHALVVITGRAEVPIARVVVGVECSVAAKGSSPGFPV